MGDGNRASRINFILLDPQIESLKIYDESSKEVSVVTYGKAYVVNVKINTDGFAYPVAIIARCSEWKSDILVDIKNASTSSGSDSSTSNIIEVGFSPQASNIKKSGKLDGTITIEAILLDKMFHNYFLKTRRYNTFSPWEINANVLCKKELTVEITKTVVVIDPGHGGKDPGVPAYKNERHEKDIVLITGKYVKDLLENSCVKVVMTRDDDTFKSLTNRVTVSKDNNAELFVSIHVDSGGKESTDEDGNKIIIYNETADTVKVYKRKSPNETTKILSKNITRELNKVVTSSKAVTETEGNYHVTREQEASVGAVLIEIGFITNKIQEGLMNTDDYLLKIATAIKDGIINTIQS